jgi:hypothetical protein
MLFIVSTLLICYLHQGSYMKKEMINRSLNHRKPSPFFSRLVLIFKPKPTDPNSHTLT